MSFMNQKGQAALVDSIIFLTIVSAIVTMLFFFMVDYGDRVNVQLDALYAEDFSMDTLKVITYINVLRDGRSVFDYSDDEDNSPEYDYLLAIMKEDYADTGKFSLNTKKAIVNTIADTLRPFEKSIDYTFFLLHEDSDDFLFLLFAVHEGEFGTDGSIQSVERKYYECQPGDKEDVAKEIFPYVGEVNNASGKIMLTEPYSEGSTPFIMSLNLWISKDIKVLQNLETPGTGVFDFNCTELDTVVEID